MKPLDIVVYLFLASLWAIAVYVYFEQLTLGHLVMPVALPIMTVVYALLRHHVPFKRAR